MEIGQKKNRLKLLEKFIRQSGKKTATYGKFICDCGAVKEIKLADVRRGGTVSCGCYHREMTGSQSRTHGLSKTRTYQSWQHMKERCLNKNVDCYKYYAGRGITISKEWESFENFYADMGERPTGMTLDRIDNSKGYYKDNCRWATYEEQSDNRRNTSYLTYNGKTQSIKKWAKELGIAYEAIRSRIKKGLSVDDALSGKKLNAKYYTHKGQTLTAEQWADKLGVKPQTMRARICRRLSPDKIFK